MIESFFSAISNWESILFGAILSSLAGILATIISILFASNQRKRENRIKEECIIRSLCISLEEIQKQFHKYSFGSRRYSVAIEQAIFSIAEYLKIYRNIKLYSRLTDYIQALRFELEQFTELPDKCASNNQEIIHMYKSLRAKCNLLKDRIESIEEEHWDRVDELLAFFEKQDEDCSKEVELINTCKKKLLGNLIVNSLDRIFVSLDQRDEKLKKFLNIDWNDKSIKPIEENALSKKINQVFPVCCDKQLSEDYLEEVKKSGSIENEIKKVLEHHEQLVVTFKQYSDDIIKEVNRTNQFVTDHWTYIISLDTKIREVVEAIYMYSSKDLRQYLQNNKMFGSVVKGIPQNQVEMEFWERIKHFYSHRY